MNYRLTYILYFSLWFLNKQEKNVCRQGKIRQIKFRQKERAFKKLKNNNSDKKNNSSNNTNNINNNNDTSTI